MWWATLTTTGDYLMAQSDARFQINIQYEDNGEYSPYWNLTRGEAIQMFEPENPAEVPPMTKIYGRIFEKTSIHHYRSRDGKMTATIQREQ